MTLFATGYDPQSSLEALTARLVAAEYAEKEAEALRRVVCALLDRFGENGAAFVSDAEYLSDANLVSCRDPRDDGVWLFAERRPLTAVNLSVAQCRYCGTTWPDTKAVPSETCPACAAPLSIQPRSWR